VVAAGLSVARKVYVSGTDAAVTVANINNALTGSVTITGTAALGQVLTASHNLADADGLGTISWQWLRNSTAISGATGTSYTLVLADQGQTVAVRASYVDGFGKAEGVTSTATSTVTFASDTAMSPARTTGTQPGAAWAQALSSSTSNTNVGLGGMTPPAP
jgi:hypothetical protein